MPSEKRSAWSRPRTPVLFGLAGLTTCLVVDAVALMFGAAATGTAALFLKPLAGALVATGVALALVIGVRRLGQRGASCSASASGSAVRAGGDTG
jgi:hypothetical protein